jgi:hypothetical protein
MAKRVSASGEKNENHMIPPENARRARMLNRPSNFDEE